MRKFNKVLKGLVFIGFILLMTNCATEEIAQQNVSQSSNDAKIWFDANKNNYSTTILEYANNFEWQNAIVSNGDIGEVIEVPFNLLSNLSATSKQADLFNDHHRLMFVRDENNGFKLFNVQIFTTDKKDTVIDKDFNYYSIKDNFDGKILVQELATDIGSKLEFKDGKKIQRSITARYDEEVCVYYGYWYEDGHFEALYEVGCFGGGGSAPPPSPGSGTPGPGYGNGGGGSNPTEPSENTCPDGYVKKLNQCILDKKIFDQLTGKAKCIYERLMASTLFSTAIKKFDGDFAVSHLKLTINNNLDANVFAITVAPVNYVTEIQFDNTKLALLSDLGNAVVFAHEVIHAEIFRKMLSAAQNGSLDPATMTTQQQVAYVNSLKNNYPGLMDYYYNRNHPNWNHDMIASHYRGTIADVIQQFDNNRLPRSTYESVTWLGLGKLGGALTTVAWDNLSPAEQTAITNLINENLYKGPSTCSN